MKNLAMALALVFSMTVMGHPANPANPSHTVKKEKTQAAQDRERIGMGGLPKATRQYLKENFPIRQVREIYKSRTNGQLVYEVGIRLEGEMHFFRFDSNGELIDL